MTDMMGVTLPAADLPVEARRCLAALLREGAPAPQDALVRTGWIARDGRLRAGAACLFGSDVGGTKIQSVLCDLDGRVLCQMRDATPPDGGEAVLGTVVRHLAELSVGRGVVAAGVGLPGAVHPQTGELSHAPNLPGLEGLDLRAELSARFGLPAAVENDVNLAAFGEIWRGHGVGDAMAGTAGLAFVALGTGIGLGFAYGDRLVRGRRGAAGEIAFLPLGGDPRDPAVRHVGALESVVSGAALVEEYRRLGGTRAGSLRELARDTADDPVLDTVMAQLAERLALAIHTVNCTVEPSLFVLGGGIGSQPGLLEGVVGAFDGFGVPAPEIRVSHLGASAGAIGAIRAARLLYADLLADT